MFEKKQKKQLITISVIIPVYNVEPWIDRCIESLKAQKQEGLEFIFIDDCSTDGSVYSIEAFANEDSRVCLIKNKTNIGPGPSRNMGIELARGEYLSFIDPDDWISEDFYTTLYEKACKTGSDIIKGRIEIVDHNEVIKRFNKAPVLNHRIKLHLRRKIPLFILFTSGHQTAIYKSSFIKKENIKYGNSRKGQDTTFLLNVCLKTEEIQFCNKAVYYYFHNRADSTVNDFSISRIINERDSLKERLNILPKNDMHIFTIRYISGDIMNCINTLACLHKESCPNDDLRKLQEQLKRQIMMVNELDTIYRLRPEIKAFVEYDSLIPTRNARPSNDLFTDGVIEWLEFIEKHPKLTDTFVIDGSALALVFLWLQRIVSVLYPLTKRRYHKPENYKLIREQWNRLEKNVRFRIVLRLPKACYSFFCGRLCKC